jgi:glycosyltransferase involved in cell wall biosynthesis
VVLPDRGELAERLEDAGAEVLTRPLAVLRRRHLSAAGLTRLVATARRDGPVLAGLASERNSSLVVCNTSVVLARPPGLPRALHVREIYAGAAGRVASSAWPLLRTRLEGADALVCVSEAVAAQFRNRERVHVVHDGLPQITAGMPRDQARADLGLPPDAFVAALLGRISDWKGQDVLGAALAEPELEEIGAIGLVAGDPFPGEERALADLDRSTAAAGDRFRVLGFRADITRILGAADVVVVPSKRPDPLPNSALEALAAGVPVVAAAHGGLPEIVRDGETGLLVPPGDARALAAALRRLADDPSLRERMGVAAAADVRERFALERMLDGADAVYRSLI